MGSFIRCCGVYLALYSLLFRLVTSQTKELQRLGNLDYLDVPALAYYLTPTTRHDFDVAILFYAQRDSNSHALAPVWKRISETFKAGTSHSNLIIGLFDCEKSQDHLDLCQIAGVQYYPALGYISLKNHKFRGKQPQHITFFPGQNWRYELALTDWLKSMQFLSRWNTRPSKSKTLEPLPLGVPKTVSNEVEVETLRNATQKSLGILNRTANFVDTLLTPRLEPGVPQLTDSFNVTFSDLYAHLQGAWKSETPDSIVLVTCASELALDYCSRLSSSFTDQWLEDLLPTHTLTDADFVQFESDLITHLKIREPYCAVLDDCIRDDFANATTCTPASCPFRDTTGCRYLSACFAKSLQSEYAVALGVGTTSDPPEEQPQKRSGFSWGL